MAPHDAHAEPRALRRLFAPSRSAAIALFTAPIAGFALGSAFTGGVGPWAIIGAVAPPAIFGVRLYLLAAERRTLIERVRTNRGHVCTTCAGVLPAGSSHCPSCNLRITPDQAAAVWMRSRLGN